MNFKNKLNSLSKTTDLNHKSLFAIGTLVLAIVTSGIAQNSSLDLRDNLSIGIKAGINSSNVWDEQGQDFRADPRLGFAGGAFLSIPIGTYIGIQPEVLFSQKGFQGEGVLLGQNYSFSRTTTHIDIPLQFQLKPIEYLTIVLGPQYSYILNEKNVYTFGSNSTEQEEQFENDNIRKNILGFVAGADINIKNFVIAGRFGWDLQTNNGDGTSDTPRYKNQWLQLCLGLRI